MANPASVVRRRYARDDDPDLELAPRGAEDPTDYSQIDSDDCIAFLQVLLAKLPPGEREPLIEKLATLVAMGESRQDGVPDNNQSAVDRRRRPAADRRVAQDSAIAAVNHRGFLSRFPGAKHIDTGSFGGFRR